MINPVLLSNWKDFIYYAQCRLAIYGNYNLFIHHPSKALVSLDAIKQRTYTQLRARLNHAVGIM